VGEQRRNNHAGKQAHPPGSKIHEGTVADFHQKIAALLAVLDKIEVLSSFRLAAYYDLCRKHDCRCGTNVFVNIDCDARLGLISGATKKVVLASPHLSADCTS
jgi:hypothetical protein